MKPKKFSLHYWAHQGMERFKDGIASNNKIGKLLERARAWRDNGDGFKYRFHWYIVRNSDGKIIAQTRYKE